MGVKTNKINKKEGREGSKERNNRGKDNFLKESVGKSHPDDRYVRESEGNRLLQKQRGCKDFL